MTNARPAKRRRLNNATNHQTQAARPFSDYKDSYLSAVSVPVGGSHGPLAIAEQGGCNDGRGRPTTGSTADSDRAASRDSSQCCYGMLCDIPAKLRCKLCPNSEKIPVEFRHPNHISSTLDNGAITFNISCPISARVLGELENVAEFKTQLYCHSKLEGSLEGSTRQNGKRRGKPLQLWFLNIIIFGTEALEEKVGEYLSKHKMYLQDPIGCEPCVPYRNPHIFPPDSGEIVMTDSFKSSLGNLEIERINTGPDLLAQLMEDSIPLLETEAPDIVKTDLFRHQKQALTFMLARERGWSLEEEHDIWSRQRDSSGLARYKNNVTGYCTDEAPPDFRGGLLADDMGLGKTLSMICLIAANQASPALSLSRMALRHHASVTSAVIKTTLLIVPPACTYYPNSYCSQINFEEVMQAWETQLLMHLRSGALKCHIYHGQNRKSTEDLDQYDVVITTYHTVSSIWRRQNGKLEIEKSIFSFTWHRVILDEAHAIQNPQSQLTQACCALRATRRWAITGTPIQNKLSDFASIVRFLRVHPYSDQKTFEEEIFKPWQNRQNTNAQGFLRLKRLVRAVTLSRTKAVVRLPHRVDEIHHVDFTPAERDKYEAAKTDSRAVLEEAISCGKQGGKTFNVLHLLNVLRLICNHGLVAHSVLQKELCQPPQTSPGNGSPVIASNNILGGSACCSNCGADLPEDVLEVGIESQDTTICERCNSQTRDDSTGQSLWENWNFQDNGESSAPATPLIDSNMAFTIESMSTKIKALIVDLYKHNSTEKSVVFSYWTNTLDLVQLMLDDKGIRYTRIDGKTPLPQKNKAVHAFQHDNSIRVILVSITCGGAGLDLTSGSRAYLLEPHWNPMIEEQALCRVHRVGQKKNVTTIRYLMRDSVEEQIVDIQKRKKMLAQVTFAQGALLEDSIGLSTLQYLTSILK